MSSTQEQSTTPPISTAEATPIVCFGPDADFTIDASGNQPVIIVMSQIQELAIPLMKLLFNQQQREFRFQHDQKTEVLPHSLGLEGALNFFYGQVKANKERGAKIISLLFSPRAHLECTSHAIIHDNEDESVSKVFLSKHQTKEIFLNKKDKYAPHYSIH